MKTAIIITLTLLGLFTYGQTKVIITHSFQTVPKGKIWKLEQKFEGTKALVELSGGERCRSQEFFKPGLYGYLCSVDSNDRMTKHIIVGDSLGKVPYANDFTYTTTLYGAVDPAHRELFQSMIMNPPSNVWFIGWFELLEPLIFTEGTTVYTNDCLKSIQLTEYPVKKLK